MAACVKSVFGIIVAMVLVGQTGSWQAKAFILTSFDPQAVYTGNSAPQLLALDTAVGITGHTIENFEDASLIPNLSVTGANFAFPHPSTGEAWDGTNLGINTIGAPTVQFDFATGLSSFGIGVADVETDVRIIVNGSVDFGFIRDLANYNRVQDNSREVYIRIDKELADAAITQIQFISESGSSDGVGYDRLALLEDSPGPISEPGSMALLGLGFAFLTFARRRRS